MPLSEDEQRILKEIEANLNETDPRLVQEVSETTLYRHSARAIKWAVFGFVAGLALLLFTFTRVLLLGVVGFLVMLGCLLVIERNVRKLGKAGLENLTSSMRAGTLKNVFRDAGLSLAHIRRAVQYLVESGEDVAALSLVTDGDTVWACRDDGQILDALRHGQLALFVGLDRVTADVAAEVHAFDAERQEFVDGLRNGGTVADATGVPASPPTGEAASGRAGDASAPGRSRPRATPR